MRISIGASFNHIRKSVKFWLNALWNWLNVFFETFSVLLPLLSHCFALSSHRKSSFQLPIIPQWNYNNLPDCRCFCDLYTLSVTLNGNGPLLPWFVNLATMTTLFFVYFVFFNCTSVICFFVLSCDEHLTAAWMCTSSGSQTPLSRFSYDSCDSEPHWPLFPHGGCRNWGVANTICSSQPQSWWISDKLALQRRWVVGMRSGGGPNGSLPGWWRHFVTNPEWCGGARRNTYVLFMVYRKIIMATSIFAWWMSLSGPSLDL